MKLKLDDKGNVVVSEDGKPIYVADDGKEIAVDYPQTLATITRLNGEAKTRREQAEAAEAKLKLYEGIEDPEAARKALETVSNLDSKKLFDAGKIDEIKAEAERAYKEKLTAQEEKYKPVIAERDKYKADFYDEKIGGAFSRSKYIADKLAIPSDLAQARFGNAFTLENGKIIGKYPDGQLIYSRSKPGEVADFDEAFETLVDTYPHRDSILKGSGASGSGAGGNVMTVGGRKTMTRASFDALGPVERASAVREVSIVD